MSPNTAIVLDIETRSDDSFLFDPEARALRRANLKVPRSHKKADTIERWLDEQLDRLDTDGPLHAPHACVWSVAAVQLDGVEDDIWSICDGDDEAAVLRGCMDWLAEVGESVLCGFAIRVFDVPMLAFRAALHGIPVPDWWPHPKSYTHIWDALDWLGQCPGTGYHLDYWLQRFGIPVKTAQGGDIQGMSDAQVQEYNEGDVARELQLCRALATAVPELRRYL